MPKKTGMPINRMGSPPKKGEKIYYHYTTLSTLWAILDGECLRATQARFSNDSEEIEQGKRLVKQIYDEIYRTKTYPAANRLFTDDQNCIDCYIICFCGEDNKLSQWRAYCRDNGVSIGFSFEDGSSTYYFADQPSSEQTAQDIHMSQVWYTDDTHSDDPTNNIVSKEALTNIIKEELERIREQNDLAVEKNYLLSTIPLIKNAGFYEENEYRLLVCNDQTELGGSQDFPLDDYIQYYLKDDIRSPYLNISFGRAYPKTITKKLHGVQEITLYNTDSDIAAAIKCKLSRITIQEKADGKSPCIIIGPAHEKYQKEIFETVDRIITGHKTSHQEEIPIWCAGHPPIRSICVSPSANQDQVIQSIKHFCLHGKYWLKYVTVKGSTIPYRRPK